MERRPKASTEPVSDAERAVPHIPSLTADVEAMAPGENVVVYSFRA